MQNDAAGPSYHDPRAELRTSVMDYLTNSLRQMDDVALAKSLVDTVKSQWQNNPAPESEYWVGAVNAAGNLLRHAASQMGFGYEDRDFDFGSVVTDHTFVRLTALHDHIATNSNAMRNLAQWARETDRRPDQRADNSPHTAAMQNLEQWARETSRPNQRDNSRHTTDRDDGHVGRGDRTPTR